MFKWTVNVVLTAGLIGVSCAERAQNPTGPQTKKLIEYGVHMSSIAYAKDNIQQMEKAPFDGVALRWTYDLNGSTYDATHDFFAKAKLPAEAASQAIADLQATPFNRFTDNFLTLRAIPIHDNTPSAPGYHGDWYDDAWWDNITYNATLAATVAKEGGLKGFMLDFEAYKGHPFEYLDQKYQQSKSFDEYAAKARERGRQMMKAITSVYPDIIIIMPVSASDTASTLRRGTTTIEQAHLELLPGFIDGIIDASTPQTTLIDGCERAYSSTKYQQFVDAHDMIRRETAKLSVNPERYEKKMQVSFGLSTGHVSPEDLQKTMRYAYTLADEYVWLWSPKTINWWEGNVLKEYWDVLVNSRRALSESEINEIKRLAAETQNMRKSIRPPLVATIYSNLRGQRGTQYDGIFKELAWKSHKWENVNVDDLTARLDSYDILLFQPNYNLANTQDLRKYQEQWLEFLKNGGIILVTEVQGSAEQLDWIVDLGPDFNLALRTFGEFQKGSSWKNLDSELDFGFVKPTWAHFTDWAQQWVVTNHNVHEKPIIVYQKVGKGLLVVSTTYLPFFSKARDLETIWYRWKWGHKIDGP